MRLNTGWAAGHSAGFLRCSQYQTQKVHFHMSQKHDIPGWVKRGKTVRQLIQELTSLDDPDIEVRISLDDGETHKAISIVESVGKQYCVLINSEDYYNSGWQDFMNEGDNSRTA
jgi:hypothetical protein